MNPKPSSPFDALPVELISEIFLPIRDVSIYRRIEARAEHWDYLLPLLLVCKRWHSIATQTPGLWNWMQVSSGFSKNQTLLLEWLRRSDQLPLELYVFIDCLASDARPILLPILHRWGSIVVRSSSERIVSALGTTAVLPWMMSLRIPNLVTLDLGPKVWTCRSYSVQCPKLRTFRSWRGLNLQGGILPSLDSGLHLTCLQMEWKCRRDLETILRIVAASSETIEDLTLSKVAYPVQVLSEEPLRQTASCPRLRRVNLSAAAFLVLAALDLPNLEMITITRWRNIMPPHALSPFPKTKTLVWSQVDKTGPFRTGLTTILSATLSLSAFTFEDETPEELDRLVEEPNSEAGNEQRVRAEPEYVGQGKPERLQKVQQHLQAILTAYTSDSDSSIWETGGWVEGGAVEKDGEKCCRGQTKGSKIGFRRRLRTPVLRLD